MSLKPLSIRTVLLLTISLLTLFIVGLSTRSAYTEWEKLLKIHALHKATFTSDMLFEAVEKCAVLRDKNYFIMYTPDKEEIDNYWPKLVEEREDADQILQSVIESLKEYNFPGLAPSIAATEAEFAKLIELRDRVDAQMLLPKEKRDRKLFELWFRQVTNLVLQMQTMWVRFIRNFSDIDPNVSVHMRFKNFLSIVIDYTGRERSLIGRMIVENARPTVEEQGNLLRWRGSVEMSWSRIHSLGQQSGISEQIEANIKDAESHYTTLYEMVRDIFYIPGVKVPLPYPIGVDLWLEISNQATDSLYTLKDSAVKQTRDYVAGLEEKAKNAMITNLVILAISLLLCFYSFWVIIFRVLHPVNRIVDALIDVTKGKPAPFSSEIAKRQDEIGKLGKVMVALQQNMERYKALVEASSQVVWTWEPGESGQMESLEKWWEEVTGQPGKEILPWGWLKVVHPEDKERAEAAWKESSTKGKGFDVEYRIRENSGKYRYIYAKAVPIWKEDGTLREFVGTISDITRRKQVEEALQLYTKDLERSNKELDDFAYIASHDLKEPLRGIHNHSRFLLEDNQDKLDEDSVSRLNRLVYLSQRMERLVNDLLYFSRLGRQDLAIQPSDLNEIVADIESTLDVFLSDHNAKIIVPKALPTIVCDKPRIAEVLRNLITNAIKYNDKENKLIEIGFIDKFESSDGQAVKDVCYVKDEGRGIASEFYEEIFRIFKRLQTSSKEDGTGVGLTFVKKIIERHGGKIWLESEVNKGSVFYFTLGGQNNGSNT
ncbi:MAG: multi-sensor signal transduction histidine kinase [Rickettsiaceae bacterium]|jgi:PAS domain S-box-containing protein|nr:multi-sensor signal transduction histidine kinase [Rickettsiaceae bacterium]